MNTGNEKSRQRNSQDYKLEFLDEIKLRTHQINSKFSSTVTKSSRKNAWLEITAALNIRHPENTRTLSELQLLWRNIQRQAKHDYALYKLGARKTGRGTNEHPLSLLSLAAVDILGEDSPILEGLQGQVVGDTEDVSSSDQEGGEDGLCSHSQAPRTAVVQPDEHRRDVPSCSGNRVDKRSVDGQMLERDLDNIETEKRVLERFLAASDAVLLAAQAVQAAAQQASCQVNEEFEAKKTITALKKRKLELEIERLERGGALY